MSKALTLSIIIPAFNEEHHLTVCLEAISKQIIKPEEVIVVDNNSSDRTAEIAKSFPFVKLIKEPRQGVVFARDRGFDAATTDIIGRIDADTMLPPHWVGAVKQLFGDEAVAAVTGPVSYYDMPLSHTNYLIDHFIRLHLYRGAPYVPFLFGSNLALRRSAWQQVEKNVCRHATIHEDLDLAIHLAQAGLVIHYDRRLLAGTSARRYDDSPRAFLIYMKMYRRTYRQHAIVSFAPRIATSSYWLGYWIMRPFRLAYDDTTGRRTLGHLFAKHHARKNPMSR